MALPERSPHPHDSFVHTVSHYCAVTPQVLGHQGGLKLGRPYGCPVSLNNRNPGRRMEGPFLQPWVWKPLGTFLAKGCHPEIPPHPQSQSQRSPNRLTTNFCAAGREALSWESYFLITGLLAVGGHRVHSLLLQGMRCLWEGRTLLSWFTGQPSGSPVSQALTPPLSKDSRFSPQP